MKKILFLFLVLFLMSCATTKKVKQPVVFDRSFIAGK